MRGRNEWSVADLREAASCGQATAYEVLRVLRAIELVRRHPPNETYTVATEHSLLPPLAKLLGALQEYVDTPVDRPPRGRRRG